MLNNQRTATVSPNIKIKIIFCFRFTAFFLGCSGMISPQKRYIAATLRLRKITRSRAIRLTAVVRRSAKEAIFGSLQTLDSASKTVDGLGDFYHPAGICWRWHHRKTLHPHDLVEVETTSACAAAALYRRTASRIL